MQNTKKLIISVVICEAIGLLGSVVTFPSIPTWYVTLHKPTFTPPNWLFGPVWSMLFVLMGVAVYQIWKKGIKTKKAKRVVQIFGMQLALNFFWSLLFFGMHSPILALLDILILWFAILWTLLSFAKIDKLAAWLMTPYLAWVSFASVLNLFIVKLN